jgi:hypothetical protein
MGNDYDVWLWDGKSTMFGESILKDDCFFLKNFFGRSWEKNNSKNIDLGDERGISLALPSTNSM